MPAASGPPQRIQSLKLDGEVYASPIVVRGLTIVATEQDTVYAFDRSYRQVWKRSLGSPSPAEERQCGRAAPAVLLLFSDMRQEALRLGVMVGDLHPGRSVGVQDSGV